MKKDSILKLIKGILYFLLFFVFIRLLRTDIIEGIKKINFIKNNSENLGSYFVFGTGLVSIYIIYSYRFILNKLKGFVYKILKNRIDLKIGEEKMKLINIFLAIIFLILIIIYDYSKNGIEVFHKLYLIFTLYLALSIGIKMLFYSYKITFQIGEQNYINIEDLKTGEIIDKTYLIKMFGAQIPLGFGEENKKGIFYPNPTKYILELENPVNKKEVKLINKLYKIVNTYHKKNDGNYIENFKIKILKTFSFGPYIFLGFLITFFYGDNIVSSLIVYFINIFKSFTNH
ncbi:MAG: hypothetical protein PHZ26_02430 [Candidatus Gracilibacteria bacterium]|nr:hypothetical protein [Candidatus Gracilibacteria bacterium]MDD2908589.1 hypothetical protein [Candidatus Gracilibacteria bacterium]